MLTRNFGMQDLPYSRLLQIPDDEREFLTLEELKPHQLTELGVEPHKSVNENNQVHGESSGASQMQSNDLQNASYQHSIYYDLNEHGGNGSCQSQLYMDGNLMATIDQHHHQVLQDEQHQQSMVHHEHQSSQFDTESVGSARKRKYSHSQTEKSDDLDDYCDGSKSGKNADDNKKQNHSEIEKRRRDKMNTYISELSAMIPMCHAMSRKLDKLTVLRMAVQHLKTIRGTVQSYTEGHYKPAFLTEQELKALILQTAEGFMFVVGCDRGRILYVSESVSKVLNYSQCDLMGQSWFDILHPKDVSKVKEQLSSSDLSVREKLIDAKTMLPVKTDVPQSGSRLCPGARRSFFCRMKCKVSTQIKEEVDSSTSNTSSNYHRRKSKNNSDKKYVVIQCTGYLKSWAKNGLEEHQETTECDTDSYNLSCLVAVGRIQPNIYQQQMNSPNPNPCLRNIQFLSRHAMDGKFLFVDQRATPVLGFLPQELLGTSMYEYYHPDDIPMLAESHKAALQSNQQMTTPIYRLRTKDGSFIRIQSEWKSFRNPWTKEIEYLIAKNNIILSEIGSVETGYQAEGSANNVTNYEFFNNQSTGRDMQQMINTHIEASKIGRQIADQVLNYQRRIGDSSAESSPDPEQLAQMVPVNDPTLASSSLGLDHNTLTPLIVTTRINGTLPSYSHMRSNVSGGTGTVSEPGGSDAELTDGPSELQATNTPTPTAEGNDEAAMAVIMSLLEADAGLGGPVDFSGLPWPLP